MFLFITFWASAQSTYLNPWRGATHTYTAAVTDAGNDNAVRWYVTTNASGTTKAVHGSDFDFITSGYNAGTDQLEGTAVYSVQIQWGTTIAEAANYYVYLEVDDETSGCTNRMALHIQIAADFNALVYDVTGSASPGTVDPNTAASDVEDETCPDDVTDAVWNGTGHSDIGYSELVFRVERQFSVLAWQFEYALSEAGSKAFSIESIRFVDEGGTELYSGTNATGTVSVNSSEDYVLVYVQITNQQDVSLELDMDLLTANNLTKDADDNLDSSTADNNADHRILPMPAITGFSGS